MKCCEGNCNQGRDCPNRVARVGWSYPRCYGCNGSQWRKYLRPAAKCLLAVLFCWLLGCLFLFLVV